MDNRHKNSLKDETLVVTRKQKQLLKNLLPTVRKKQSILHFLSNQYKKMIIVCFDDYYNCPTGKEASATIESQWKQFDLLIENINFFTAVYCLIYWSESVLKILIRFINRGCSSCQNRRNSYSLLNVCFYFHSTFKYTPFLNDIIDITKLLCS